MMLNSQHAIRYSRLSLNSKNRQNKKIHKLAFTQQVKKLQLTPRHYKIGIPFCWKTVVLYDHAKDTFVFYLYSGEHYFTFAFQKKSHRVFFDKNARVINLSSLYTSNYYALYLRTLNEILNLFAAPVFKKLKFRGKGYYIYKNKRI